MVACSPESDVPEPSPVVPMPSTVDTTKVDISKTDQNPVAVKFAAKYRVAKMQITTDGQQAVDSKEKADYRNCTIKIESDTAAWNYEGRGRIRGRGNSTWIWYPKKPYRIKLDEKASVLGLDANKDWVLLANYRDPTHLMNTFVFEMGYGLNMPFTNHTRYVEVTLNGDYIGLYQLTEQIEVGKSRVDIGKKKGWL